MTALPRQIHDALTVYLDALTSKDAGNYYRYVVHVGRKYIKVIRESDNQRSVHSFIDKQGNVYKPAGWAGPAKGVRWNLLTQMDKLVEVCDPYGGYLYMDRINA